MNKLQKFTLDILAITILLHLISHGLGGVGILSIMGCHSVSSKEITPTQISDDMIVTPGLVSTAVAEGDLYFEGKSVKFHAEVKKKLKYGIWIVNHVENVVFFVKVDVDNYEVGDIYRFEINITSIEYLKDRKQYVIHAE